MKKNRWLNLLIYIVALFSLLGTSACGQAAETGPRVWIDFPRDGVVVPFGTVVTVLSHAYARDGVAEIVLTIDGAAFRRDAPATPGAQYVQVNQDWLPPAEGTYALQVQAYGVGGQISNLASITVRVGSAATATPIITATPVITATLVPTETPTLTLTSPPPSASFQFWADPSQIQAGACTTIRWHVENAARVVFGGVDQPFDGSYQACLCHSERYTLTVVQLDASQVSQTVDIPVNGSCVTPTTPAPPQQQEQPPEPQPQQDTTAPPVPSPAVPANGLTLSCRASQTLAWLPVTDPSTPVRYYVKLEIKVTAKEWRSAGGYGPITGKQVDANVQCGGIYRWVVRAEDAAGNVSNWSAPSGFAINLD
jgi:hypothetical protein